MAKPSLMDIANSTPAIPEKSRKAAAKKPSLMDIALGTPQVSEPFKLPPNDALTDFGEKINQPNVAQQLQAKTDLSKPGVRAAAAKAAAVAAAKQRAHYGTDQLFRAINEEAKNVPAVRRKGKVELELDKSFAEDGPDQAMYIAARSKDPSVRKAAADYFARGDDEGVRAVRERLGEINRQINDAVWHVSQMVNPTVVGTKAVAPDLGQKVEQTERKYAKPISDTLVSTVNPLGFLELATSLADDPQGTWEGIKRSFAAIADPNAKPEERIASATQWALTLLTLGKAAMRGKVAFIDTPRIKSTLIEEYGFSPKDAGYVVDQANKIVNLHLKEKGRIGGLIDEVKTAIKPELRANVARAGADIAYQSGRFESPPPNADFVMGEQAPRGEVGPAPQDTPVLERYNLGRQSGGGPAKPSPDLPTAPAVQTPAEPAAEIVPQQPEGSPSTPPAGGSSSESPVSDMARRFLHDFRIERTGNVNDSYAGLPYMKRVEQPDLASLLPEGRSSVYHETNVTGGKQLLQRFEAGLRDHTLIYASDNPDLAIGIGGRGIVFEMDPRRLNGAIDRSKPASEIADGNEYVISKSAQGAVQAITFKTQRQLDSYAKEPWIASRFDFSNPVQSERGITILRKGKYANSRPASPAVAAVSSPAKPASLNPGVKPQPTDEEVVARFAKLNSYHETGRELGIPYKSVLDAIHRVLGKPAVVSVKGVPVKVRAYRNHGTKGIVPGTGTFYAETLAGAKRYQGDDGGVVLEHDLDLKNALVIDGTKSDLVTNLSTLPFSIADKAAIKAAASDSAKKGGTYSLFNQAVARAAKNAGFDGIVYKQPRGETEYVDLLGKAHGNGRKITAGRAKLEAMRAFEERKAAPAPEKPAQDPAARAKAAALAKRDARLGKAPRVEQHNPVKVAAAKLETREKPSKNPTDRAKAAAIASKAAAKRGTHTPEEFQKRIDALQKISRAGGAHVFDDLKQKGVLGLFENPTKPYRFGRIRMTGKLSDADYADALAHEVAHELDALLSKAADPTMELGQTTGDVDVLFDTRGDHNLRDVIKAELVKVSRAMVGDETYDAHPRYYSKPTELYARFLQAHMFFPNLIDDLAPFAAKKLVDVSRRHPLLSDYLNIAKGGMLEHAPGFMFLPDARQGYIKKLGRYVGTKAFGNEILYRGRRAQALAETESLIQEKFIGIRDKASDLFDAAEGIKVTKGGKPVFGTRIKQLVDPKASDYKTEVKALRELGFKRVGRTADDKMLFSKWRKTPEEAEMAYNKLSPKGKALIREYTADLADGKDLFSREVQREVYKIDSEIEGYVHHFGFKDKAVSKFRAGRLKQRKAAAQKQRAEKEGYTKDFRLAVTKSMAELRIAKEWNEFVSRQIALIAEPITETQPLKRGWRKVDGDVIAGFKEPGADREWVIRDGKRFLLKRGKSYQVPNELYDRYIKGGPFGEEITRAEAIMRSVNSYWQRNILLHPGTAMTNFISGGIQFSAKILEDFYRDILYHDGPMLRTRSNVAGFLVTMTPGGWKGAADWTFGGDESLLYNQFFNHAKSSRGAYSIPGMWNKTQDSLMKPYQAIERFWKKVIVNSELAKSGGSKALRNVHQRQHLLNDPEFLKAVNDVVDLYAYDYNNIPNWMEAAKRVPIVGLTKPFMTYPYKYMKMMTSMAGGAFDRNLPIQDRIAKMLAIGSILTAIYLCKKAKEEERLVDSVNAGTAVSDDELKLKSVVNARGRVFIGRDEQGKEVFTRTAKYPFFNAVDAIDSLLQGDPESALEIVRDQVGTLGPTGKFALNQMGYRGEFDKFKDLSTMNAETAASFLPYGRILHDTAEVLDPKQRNLPQDWRQVFGQYVPTINPDLRKALAGEEATAKVPLTKDEVELLRHRNYTGALESVERRLGAEAAQKLQGAIDEKRQKGKAVSFSTLELPIPKRIEDELMQLFGGIYLKRIDREWYDRFRERAIENKEKSASSQ